MKQEEIAKVAEGVACIITDNGIGIYHYGQPMSEVVPGNGENGNLAIWLWKGIEKPDFDKTYLNIYAITEKPISWDKYDGTQKRHVENPQSKIDNFRIQIRNNENENWIQGVIISLEDSLQNRGFKMVKNETRGQKNAVLLAKGDFNIFIMNNCDNTIEVITGYDLINSKIYGEFYKIFISDKVGDLA